MHSLLIILDSLDEWTPFYDTQSIITAKEYLQNEYLSNQSHLVLNLSNDLGYNTEGYYCSLLAKARGHKVIPDVETINRLNAEAFVRLEKPLQKICYQYTKKNNPENGLWQFDIYFGTCKEEGLEKIARYLFEQFHCPVLRVTLNTNERNQIESIKHVPISGLNDKQQDYFAEALDNFSKKVWREPRAKKPFRYDLAILYDPSEAFPPSDRRALNKFMDIAKKMNINAELITADDSTRLMEFDALFIRQTTSLNHITYQLAQKAAQADMVVIDDPVSIIRCTNKVYLKELLDKESVAVPNSTLLFRSSKNSFEQVSRQLGLPIVIKTPDGSFSHGVKKVNNRQEFEKTLDELFLQTSVLLAQEYIPTEYDWRIGVLNKEPIYACKYYMAKGHWQIYNHKISGKSSSGNYDTLPIYQVPKVVIRTAVKATSLIGKGLYGVDLKQVGEKCVVIEINDNPNIDYGVEDAILGDELYGKILREFVIRLEQKHAQ
ncbi:MAG: RimK family protein [Bacteroidales bacterium]|jgi:glutathione synthase/RimK-type ligase-like ATP-grasp enzyme|nr:RimK family protein [Bacteroidales bacterium]